MSSDSLLLEPALERGELRDRPFVSIMWSSELPLLPMASYHSSSPFDFFFTQIDGLLLKTVKPIDDRTPSYTETLSACNGASVLLVDWGHWCALAVLREAYLML